MTLHATTLAEEEKVQADLATIAQRLQDCSTVGIFTHARPDPDAIGSQLACARALHSLGIRPTLIDITPVPPTLEFLYAGAEPISRISLGVAAAGKAPALPNFDGILLVDTHSVSQLEGGRDYILQRRATTLVIDHHRTGDNIASVMACDTSAAACVELIADLLTPLNVPLSHAIAEPLYAGLVGDTGWFRFDSVTPRTHALARQLLATGVEPAAMYRQLAQQESPAKLRLMAAALASLQYLGQQQIAVMTLSKSDFIQAGAESWQTDGLVDWTMSVGTVEVVALLSETDDGRTRVNLRSKTHIDVSAICAHFGGGGHARAAGCRMTGSPAMAAAQLTPELLKAVKAQ